MYIINLKSYKLKVIKHFKFIPKFFIHRGKLYITWMESVVSIFEKYEPWDWKLKRVVIFDKKESNKDKVLDYP